MTWSKVRCKTELDFTSAGSSADEIIWPTINALSPKIASPARRTPRQEAKRVLKNCDMGKGEVEIKNYELKIINYLD
jgi:hypothetical protein